MLAGCAQSKPQPTPICREAQPRTSENDLSILKQPQEETIGSIVGVLECVFGWPELTVTIVTNDARCKESMVTEPIDVALCASELRIAERFIADTIHEHGAIAVWFIIGMAASGANIETAVCIGAYVAAHSIAYQGNHSQLMDVIGSVLRARFGNETYRPYASEGLLFFNNGIPVSEC